MSRDDRLAATLAARDSWRTTTPSGPPEPRREAVRHVPNPDPVVASIGLPRHPSPDDLVAGLEQTTSRIRDHLKRVLPLARMLAGSPLRASSGGSGGGAFVLVENEQGDKERVAVTSVEAAVFHGDEWRGIDRELAHDLAQLDHYAKRVAGTITRIAAHASDDDPTPAGTGACEACGIFVRPTAKRPEFRIRAGMCPADYRAWVRAGKPERGGWVRDRRRQDPDERREEDG